MALTKEDLQAIGQLMDEKLDARLTPIEQKIDKLSEGMEEIRDATNYLSEWVENLDEEFQIHKIKTKET